MQVHCPTVRFPSKVYGQTALGTPLRVYLPENATGLFVAGIHGEEPETTLLASYALRSIRPDDLKMAVILAANPDGLTQGTRCNANGVDLNRNFPHLWNKADTYSRWNINELRTMPLGSGESPASEPETKALIDLVHEHDFKLVVALHAPLANIHTNEDRLGKAMSERADLPLVHSRDYPLTGTMFQWLESEDRDRITYEVGLQGKEQLREKHVPIFRDLFREMI